MAWNPSQEVQVARDAAAQLSKVLRIKVDRCVILFTTSKETCGYVSYGETLPKCHEARAIGELAYNAAFKDPCEKVGE